MRDKKEFFGILTSIDGKEPGEYAKLGGDFDFSRYVLKVSQIQDQADAGPALFVVRVPQIIAAFPPHLFNTPVRRTALEDLLTRKIASQIELLAKYDEHGVSRRRLSVATPGQKILPRTSLVVTEEYVEARLYVNLPAGDGLIDGEGLKEVFFDDLPHIVNSSLLYCNLNEREVEESVDLMEDADQIRQVLPTRGLVSFLAEGSMIARLRGTDLPDYDRLVPLSVSAEQQVEIEVPNSGKVKGLGIPTGVTLILGDDYSGRTDFTHAIAAGIYNHVHGDGRELVVTVPDAVYIASDPGRSVQSVDISAFVKGTGDGTDPVRYTTDGADACAAQAAATAEALEVGGRVLLYDELDSAPAFLSQDSRLAKLMSADARRIVPLAARARQIADELGVAVIVAGSVAVAEFIPVADMILRIEGFSVRDITQEAKKQAVHSIAAAKSEQAMTSLSEKARWIVPSSIDPSVGRHDAYIDATALNQLQFGRSTINLASVCQVADIHQTATIGLILYYAKLRYMDESRPVREVLDLIDRDLSTEGLECLTRDLRGDLARPRRYEIAAALNRLDTLRISSAAE
ncbi:MAG: hypothetical protein JXB04_09995 [Kiritimatiellae bacterium]|nr:hypothetical protein [Kiritimatiellia bacterium]